VAYIDRFGNIITDITRDDIQALQDITKKKEFSIHLGDTTIQELKSYYQQGSTETPHALVNSNGLVEIFLRQARASDKLGVTLGLPVLVN
jgi:S-adenosylmethionine hydrolase